MSSEGRENRVTATDQKVEAGGTRGALGQLYADAVCGLLKEILEFSSSAIPQASAILADRIAEGKPVFVAGTGGHSHIAAFEVFYRAGGLAAMLPMLDVGYALSKGGRAAMEWERTAGKGAELVDSYGIAAGDAFIINNPYGVNTVTIDAALRAKQLGATVIALTSPQIAGTIPREHPSRHPAGLDLYQVADVTIDTRVPPGDAVLQLRDLPVKVAGVSTATTCFCLNWLVAETARQLIARGIAPPVWMSANLPGGDEFNSSLMVEYVPRIRHL